MKTIELKSITLRNWRGEKERTTTMNDGRPTTISGGNGKGKSRHMDAFLWLLFGKDSQNRTNYEVRTYDSRHEPLHKVECSVEATLTVDGHPLTIKREWRENWVKPKGQPDEVLRGSKGYFWWDGVPVLEKEYTKRVGDVLMDEQLFKMITNPAFFVTNMKWDEQRAELMRMAGESDWATLAQGNADFMALLDRLSGKSLADYRKEVAARKKLLKDEQGKIPARIDEVQRHTPAAEDWDALATEQKQLADEQHSLDIQLRHRDERNAAQIDKLTQIRREARELQARQQELISEARHQAQADADKRNERRTLMERELKQLHTELSQATIDDKRATERIDYLHAELDKSNTELQRLRNEWYDINRDEYDTQGDICPCCGQRLPEDKLAEAREAFKAHKQKRLADNNDSGKRMAERTASLNEELNKLLAEAETRKPVIAAKQKRIEALTKDLMDTPVAKPKAVDFDTIPDYQQAQRRIDELLQEKMDVQRGMDAQGDAKVVESLNKRKVEIEARDRAITLLLAKRTQIDECEQRKQELTERGKDVAQQIADLEREEYIAAQLNKAKINDCEQRINDMFSMVRWQLFTYTQEGNEVETCVPLIDGVPYGAANTASRMNAGLDIINTLCRKHAVSAPIFIDNAESVSDYMDTISQVIFLEVRDGAELEVR